MSWLRRLSRDRTSKGEQDFKNQGQMPNFRPHSSYTENNQNALYKDSQYPSTHTSQDMLQSYRRSAPLDQQMSSPQQRPPGTSSDATMHTAPANVTTAPDTLTRAFNDAIRPYVEQIDLLKNQIEDANLQIQQLEDERADMHAWIDKRGLRPDLPSHLASTIPTSALSASTLSHQLDRKMTMLNYDLHRLADSLPTPLPTSTIAQPLSTLLPPIAHLSTLPSGPAFAFELLIKLGGNLNSHHTSSSDDTSESTMEDTQSRENFYEQLDSVMLEVVRRRVEQGTAGEEHQQGGGWQIARDVKRLEKTGAFLEKEMGLQNYFKRTLDMLRYQLTRGEPVQQTRYSP